MKAGLNIGFLLERLIPILSCVIDSSQVCQTISLLIDCFLLLIVVCISMNSLELGVWIVYKIRIISKFDIEKDF